ncbi:MAG: hypothetical protein KDB86_11385 [Actinobacteria bacterium]|nr:hypothetical protein [Actinomycetota bacterium]MCB9388991.1 hypothetical protein [Acidimicrobiia bacterium]
MTRLFAVLALVAILTAACGSDETSSGETTTSHSETATTAVDETTTSSAGASKTDDDATTTTDAEGSTTTAAVNATVAVDVIDAGSEPRQVLTLDFKPGKREMTVVSSSSVSQFMDGTPVQQQTTPTQTVRAVQEVTEVNDGVASGIQDIQEILLDGKELEGEVKAKADEYMAQVSELTITPDGKQTPASPPATSTSTPSINIEGDTVTIFPEEPVGVGATWEVTSTLSVQGIVLDQTISNTITKIEGNLVTIESVSEASLPKGTELPAQDGSGATGIVEELTQHAETTMVYDLSWPWPIEQTSSSEDRRFIQVVQNGQTGVIGLEQKRTAELTSKPA